LIFIFGTYDKSCYVYEPSTTDGLKELSDVLDGESLLLITRSCVRLEIIQAR